MRPLGSNIFLMENPGMVVALILEAVFVVVAVVLSVVLSVWACVDHITFCLCGWSLVCENLSNFG